MNQSTDRGLRGVVADRRFSRRSALGASAVGLAAGALTVGGLTATAAPRRSSRAAGPAARWQEGGVTAESVAAAVAKLPELVGDALAKTNVPGIAVAVVYEDELIYAEGFGVREVGTTDAVDPDTLFQLASVSKPIASTIVAGVVGDGAASWDDPVVRHFPDFALADPYPTAEVTLRDLFCHRSGLPDHAGDLLEDLAFDRATILHRLRYLRPAYSFRGGYQYTNFGLTAAAVAAANAAGMEWEELAWTRLYEPLGMTRTTSRQSEYLAADNRAKGHVLENGAYVAKYVRDPDTESPAGGVSSTVRDLAQWVLLHLGGGAIDGRQLVAADALGETHRPHSTSNPAQNPGADRTGFYGLGWNVDYTAQGQVRLSHSGAHAQGAATNVQLLPAAALGIIVLTNAAPIGVPEAITFSFLDLATTGQVSLDYLTLLGQLFAHLAVSPYGQAVDYTTPPANAVPARSPDAYLGTYDNDFFGPAEIARAGDGLVLRIGAGPLEFALAHYDGDVYTYQPEGENAYGLSGLLFTVGPEGQARKALIENLDLHGHGTFVRAPLA